MSRMLDALKTLEARQHQPPPALPTRPPAPEPLWTSELPGLGASNPEATLDLATELLAEVLPELPVGVAVPRAPQPEPQFDTCALPITRDLADHYLEMGAQMIEQHAASYSSVLVFVASDRQPEPAFSMTHLAQSFALQAAGDVLLVDGNLRGRHLSKAVSHGGPGLVEAMLGQATWPEIIHPTNTARIDFVSAGIAQVPTVERAEFNWGALRPAYRYVLIGLATASEPETNWLAARCDGVYFVISRPHTRRGMASTAINSLRASGANVLGSIVVND